MFTSVSSAKWLVSSPCLGTPTTPWLTLPGTLRLLQGALLPPA